VGFYAKLSVLQALLASSDSFYIGLAVFAVLMSLVGAFYYLRLVKVMYFDEPTQTADIEAGADVRSVLTINGALVLVLGILPGGLMALCAQAVAALFA
jgi:NADH-quinone oxidoreductase subunit N